MTGIIGAILNWAERRGGWFPCVAGALVGLGAGWAAQGWAWAWLLLGAGLVLGAVRPAGTSLRRRVLIRQVRRQIAQFERQVR